MTSRKEAIIKELIEKIKAVAAATEEIKESEEEFLASLPDYSDKEKETKERIKELEGAACSMEDAIDYLENTMKK